MGKKAYFVLANGEVFNWKRCDKCNRKIIDVQDGQRYWNPNPKARHKNICKDCFDCWENDKNENYQKWINKGNDLKMKQTEGSKMEDNTFYCSRCKINKPVSELHHTGAAGSYCNDCNTTMRDKASQTARETAARNKWVDRWSGKHIPIDDRQTDVTTVSKTSRKMRENILICVRHSPLLARYVARIEKREKPHREAREKEAGRLLSSSKKQTTLPTQEINSTPENITTTERLIRLELLIVQLASKIN